MIIWIGLTALGILVTGFDVRTGHLDDRLWLGTCLWLVPYQLVTHHGWMMMTGGLVTILLATLFARVVPRAMAGGDLKYWVVLGLALGPVRAAWVLMAAALGAFCWGLIRRLIRPTAPRTIRLGPWLALASVILAGYWIGVLGIR